MLEKRERHVCQDATGGPQRGPVAGVRQHHNGSSSAFDAGRRKRCRIMSMRGIQYGGAFADDRCLSSDGPGPRSCSGLPCSCGTSARPNGEALPSTAVVLQQDAVRASAVRPAGWLGPSGTDGGQGQYDLRLRGLSPASCFVGGAHSGEWR